MAATTETTANPNAVAKLETRAKGESLWLDAWRRLTRNRLAVIGLVIILLNILMAIFAPLLAPKNYRTQVLEDNNAAPMWVINMFPIMKPADARNTLSPPPYKWEIQVENGEFVTSGTVLAVHTEDGTEITTKQDGQVYIDGANIYVTDAAVHVQPLDEDWEVLVPRMVTRAEQGQVLARNTANEQEFASPITGQLDITRDAIIVREQTGGYVTVSDDYVLGADNLGRDLLSRIIYGSRVSLSVAFIGPVVSLAVGLIFGLVSGYAGGRVDNLMMRFVDIMYAFPTILLVILLMAFFRSSFANNDPGTLAYRIGQVDAAFGGMLFIFIGIGLTAWMQLARLTRGQVLSVKEKEFIEAAQSIGARTPTILSQHVLPNILGPIIVAETLTIPTYISYEAFLSFIGLGVNPPTPSWGAMISEGARGISSYPNQAIFPALALFFVMFAFNFLGDGLRDALDPRMRGVD